MQDEEEEHENARTIVQALTLVKKYLQESLLAMV